MPESPPPVKEETKKIGTEELLFNLPATAVESFTISLNEDEAALLKCMSSQEQHVDELIRASNLPSGTVQVALFGLELKKQIQQLPGKYYRKKMK